MCAVLRHGSPHPPSLTNHRNKLGFTGRAAREVLATKCGSLGEARITERNTVCPALCPWQFIWEQELEYLEGHRASGGRKPRQCCCPENLCHSQWILMPPSPHVPAVHELQWLFPPYKAPRACTSVSDMDQGLYLISSSPML